MGREVLTKLFHEWGETVFSAALRDLYRWSLDHDYRLSAEEQEREIYEVLRAHAPVGREEEFRELYYELNGGPYTVSLPAPAPVPEEVASRMAGALPWAGSPQDGDHGVALQAVARLWQLDPVLGEGVARYPWVVDGVTLTEAVALADLGVVAAEDLEWGGLLVDRPWVGDGMSTGEQLALHSLRRLAEDVPEALGLLVDRPWVADGINEHSERLFLGTLARVSGARPDLVLKMMDIPWGVEDLSDGERRALGALGSLAEHDEHDGGRLTERALALPWVADGIAPEWDTEAWELRLLASLAEAGLEDELGLSWAVDGLTRPEREVIFQFIRAVEEGFRGLVRQLMALPWVADGIETEEEFAFHYFISIAHADVTLALRMADYAWVVDGLTRTEQRALAHLSRIIERDVVSGRRVAGYAWVADGITSTEGYALEALSTLIEEDALEMQRPTDADRRGLDELIRESWIVDGVTEAEVGRLIDLYREARAQRGAQQ